MTKSRKIENKIIDHQKILSLRQNWRNEDKKVVFTNGCFDIIHKGHINYLSKAAELGDILIVGLNSDDSVRRLKGKNRPLQDEDSRTMILAAMQFVDYVILFHEDTPYELIKTTKPDILVKGADYKAEDIVGYDIVTSSGGKVITIDFLEGYSTTSVIDKLQ